jgi:phosphoglycerate kinase
LSFGGRSGKKIFACLTRDGKDTTVESAERLGKIISRGGTVVWNGPMGVYENERDIEGTRIIAEAIVNSQALKIAGGGDTEAVINKLGLKEKFDWISSGGGAMLEFLTEGTLPGIEAIRNPKFQTLNPKQYQNSKYQCSKQIMF